MTGAIATDVEADYSLDPDRKPHWGQRVPFAIKEPSWYGEVIYHQIRFCPWCGTELPAPPAPGKKEESK